MSEAEQTLIEWYAERTLDDWAPELKPYLKKGVNVLDIGCGSGGISLGVAKAVSPGNVTGIDPMEDRIEHAIKLAHQRNVSNITFDVGDTYNLDFPTRTFDIVYSHTVLHSLIDPVKALLEQKRVAKAGGWVIAAGVRDWGFSPRYPPCPTLEKVWESLVRYHESLVSRYEAGDPVPGPVNRGYADCYYFDLHAGRKCSEWFTKAGLGELEVKINIFKVEYPGAEEMEPNPLIFLPSPDDADDPVSEVYRDIFAEEFIDKKTVEQARKEITEWYNHPYAFHFWAVVFVAGKA